MKRVWIEKMSDCKLHPLIYWSDDEKDPLMMIIDKEVTYPARIEEFIAIMKSTLIAVRELKGNFVNESISEICEIAD